MINLLKYFKSLPQRALDTCRADENTAPLFQTQIQIITLETCVFTDEQALRAKSIYPYAYATTEIIENIGFLNWLSLDTCCAARDAKALSTPLAIYLPAEDLLQINSLKTLSAYQDGANIHQAQNFELWTQNIALHFYDLKAEQALEINTWSRLSHFETTGNFDEAISVNEELGWFQYMTTVPTLCATYAYRDAVGDFE